MCLYGGTQMASRLREDKEVMGGFWSEELPPSGSVRGSTLTSEGGSKQVK